MKKLTSPKTIKNIMTEFGFSFTKSLGQNFLIDENVLKKIVGTADIGKDDYVLEVGPGIGAMTHELALRAKKVVTVEIDKALLPVLEKTLDEHENIVVLNQDILKVDLQKLESEYFNNQPYKIVANLPYYITTPVIMRFLEEGSNFSTFTMLIQKEVAQRIAANPSTKDYGALTVAIEYYCTSHYEGMVAKSVFMPAPNVDSAIIRLAKRKSPAVTVNEKSNLFKIIKAAFATRRKTLMNSLAISGILHGDKTAIKSALENSDIDPGRRGETLTIDEFAKLANEIDD